MSEITIKKGDIWLHSDIPLSGEQTKQTIAHGQEVLKKQPLDENTLLKVMYYQTDDTTPKKNKEMMALVNIKNASDFVNCLMSVLHTLYVSNPELTQNATQYFFTIEVPKIYPHTTTGETNDTKTH